MPSSNPLSSGRQYYLDIARVIAIIAISLNHAVNRSFAAYHDQLAELSAIPFSMTSVKVICSMFSNLGVPLFLMITGVLIINKRMETQEDVKRFYKHNLLPLFITTEIWLVMIYWFIVLFQGDNTVLETQGFAGAVRGMFETMLFQNQTTFGSMWYMPMILCLYTTLPFVVMVKDGLSGSKLSPVLFLPVGIVIVNDMILPAVNALLAMNGQPLLSSAVREADLLSYFYIYVLAGYLVDKGALSKWKSWLVGVMALLTFALTCAFQVYAYSTPLDYVVSYNFPLLPFCAAFLFELIRRTAQWLKGLERPVTYLSRISFGIYLIHMVVMSTVNTLMDYTGWNQALKMLFMHSTSLIGSIALIFLLSKIKLLRKYLFLIK